MIKLTQIISALVLVLMCTYSFGATKTSITNGDWNDPNTWSPVGVPVLEDTIIVDSHVTLDTITEVEASLLWIRDTLSGTGFLTIFAFKGQVLQDGVVDVPWFVIQSSPGVINNGEIHGAWHSSDATLYVNNGSIVSDTLLLNDTLFQNYGMIDVNMFTNNHRVENYAMVNVSGIMSTANSFVNEENATVQVVHLASVGAWLNKYHGYVYVTNMLNMAGGPFVNEYGGFIECAGLFTIQGDLLNSAGATIVTDSLISIYIANDGQVDVGTWINTAATGNGGKFCVAQDFLSNGLLDGTIDICDATPGGPMDFILGVVGPNVTFCQASPCNDAVGVIEEAKEDAPILTLSPNPVIDYAILTVDSFIEPYDLFIHDVNGRLIQHIARSTASQHQISAHELSPGMYVCTVQTAESTTKLKFLAQ